MSISSLQEVLAHDVHYRDAQCTCCRNCTHIKPDRDGRGGVDYVCVQHPTITREVQAHFVCDKHDRSIKMTREDVATFMNKNTLKDYKTVYDAHYMYLIHRNDAISKWYAYCKIEDMYTIKGCLVLCYNGVHHSYELA